MSKPTGKLRGLVLQDYQSHRLTKLEIHPGITVITGENLVGKSSVLRAMRSVVNFDTMRIRTRARREKTPCKVRLIFDDPLVVTRIRTEDAEEKLVNQKLVVKKGEDKQEFAKLGQSLPTAVVEQLQMGEVQVDKSTIDLNFASQHDPAFLIDPSFKGSLRLKMLGTVNDQIRFDQGLRILKAEEKEHKSGLKAMTESLHDLEDRLAVMKAGPNLAAYKVAVEDALSKLEKVERSRVSKQGVIEGWEQRNAAIATLLQTLSDLPSEVVVNRVEMDLVGLDALREEIASKQLLVEHLMATKKKVDALRVKLSTPIDFDVIEVDLGKLEAINRQSMEKRTLADQMTLVMKKIETLKIQVNDHDADLDELQETLEDNTKDGALCPFFNEVELQPACRKKILEEGMDV